MYEHKKTLFLYRKASINSFVLYVQVERLIHLPYAYHLVYFIIPYCSTGSACTCSYTFLIEIHIADAISTKALPFSFTYTSKLAVIYCSSLSPSVCTRYFFRSSFVIRRITLQGTPAASTCGGISLFTTLPAPITEPSPIVTPAST